MGNKKSSKINAYVNETELKLLVLENKENLDKLINHYDKEIMKETTWSFGSKSDNVLHHDSIISKIHKIMFLKYITGFRLTYAQQYKMTQHFSKRINIIIKKKKSLPEDKFVDKDTGSVIRYYNEKTKMYHSHLYMDYCRVSHLTVIDKQIFTSICNDFNFDGYIGYYTPTIEDKDKKYPLFDQEIGLCLQRNVLKNIYKFNANNPEAAELIDKGLAVVKNFVELEYKNSKKINYPFLHIYSNKLSDEVKNLEKYFQDYHIIVVALNHKIAKEIKNN